VSLLDTFIILFESNADEVRRAAGEAEKAVDDLEDSIEGADKGTEDLADTLSEMAGEAKKAAKAFFALYAVRAAQGRILSLAAEADELGKFSDRLNVNIGEVDAWGGAVERSGGNASSFRASLESLNEKLVETAIKGTGEIIPFFAQMGISIADANGRARSTLQILPELSNAFQSLNRQESAAIGKKLGLDNATILLLQNGNKELDKLLARQKELGVITKEDAEIAAQFNDSLSDMTRSLNALGRILVIDAIPFINMFLDAITGTILFLKQNEAFAVSFFGAIGTAIGVLLIPKLVAAIALIAPFLGIAAAAIAVAGAFALAADDVYNFLQGNKSVIGELSKSWPIVGKIIKAVTDAMAFAFSSPIEKLKTMKEIVEGIRTAWKDLKDSISSQGIEKVFDDAVLAGKALIGISSTSPINTQTQNTISNSATRGGDRNIKFGDVKVDARGGGSETSGRVMGRAMQRELRRAVDKFDDGVQA